MVVVDRRHVYVVTGHRWWWLWPWGSVSSPSSRWPRATRSTRTSRPSLTTSRRPSLPSTSSPSCGPAPTNRFVCLLSVSYMSHCRDRRLTDTCVYCAPDTLFSLAIGFPVSGKNIVCWIATVIHQTVSGGDVNMSILP